MKRYLTATLFLLSSLVAQAQDTATTVTLPHYKYKLDSTSFLIGDQAVLTIEPSTLFPTLEDLTNNDIVAVRQWIDSTDGSLLTTITSFEEGEHWYHIGADSLLLTVRDVAGVDTTSTNIKDISDILRQPYTFGEIAKVVGIILAILAIIAAAIYVVYRIKSHKPLITIPQEPPLPPDTRALNALEVLRQKQLWQQGKAKEYHTELTDIVRNYLEETYHIQSTEMTSDQTLDAFHSCPAYKEEAYGQLRQILQTADMVKFAKSEPLPYQHDLSMSQAVDFVKAIAPKPAPTENAQTDSTDPQTPNTQQ